MKYLNSLVFLGLLVVVAGCQKKESSKSAADKKHQVKKAPTKLQTKKSASYKNDGEKSEIKSVVVKKNGNKTEKIVSSKIVDHKKGASKKAVNQKKDKSEVKTQGFDYKNYY
ncbi:MAG: hypothetical protein Q8Q60_01375 [Candidatus Chromulinivorax sp.]|nr:hypothetical protein [Candidatus Chromulinivorax sp.]